MIDIQEILDRENLTIYGASQIVGAKTDEPLKTIHQRISRWIQEQPRQWKELEIFLEAMGYTVEIKKDSPMKSLTQTYKVRRVSSNVDDDYHPAQTISAKGFMDALRQYCAANGLAEPVDTYHSADDVYTAVSRSQSANVIGKFQIYQVNE